MWKLHENGGLKLINITTKAKTFQIQWLLKLITSESNDVNTYSKPWKTET